MRSRFQDLLLPLENLEPKLSSDDSGTVRLTTLFRHFDTQRPRPPFKRPRTSDMYRSGICAAMEMKGKCSGRNHSRLVYKRREALLFGYVCSYVAEP